MAAGAAIHADPLFDDDDRVRFLLCYDEFLVAATIDRHAQPAYASQKRSLPLWQWKTL